MHDLPTPESVRVFLQNHPEGELHQIIEDRLADSLHCGLEAMTHLLVVEAGDTEAQIIEAIGFSPMASRTENSRNCPDWDWIEKHAGWWELLYTVGNAGFAYILIVEACDRNRLARLCRRWTEQ